ncbi:hypothetical protein HYV73_02745 [Candidatus Uhrbacteria bacterium]|nr:hypothetical protein [Candidatus Uhrbacteria bacterium]
MRRTPSESPPAFSPTEKPPRRFESPRAQKPSLAFLEQEGQEPHIKTSARELTRVEVPILLSPEKITKMGKTLVEAIAKGRGRRHKEAKIQNDITRAMYQGTPIPFVALKRAMAEAAGQPAYEGRIDGKTIATYLNELDRGCQGMLAAIRTLESAVPASQRERLTLALNEILDAEHKIDMVSVLANASDTQVIDRVSLIQVKNGVGRTAFDPIVKAHQSYVDSLASLSAYTRQEREKGLRKSIREYWSETQEAGEQAVGFLETFQPLLLQAGELAEKGVRAFTQTQIKEWQSYYFSTELFLFFGNKDIVVPAARIVGTELGLDAASSACLEGVLTSFSDTIQDAYEKRGLFQGHDAESSYAMMDPTLKKALPRVQSIHSVLIQGGKITNDRLLRLQKKGTLLQRT